MKTIVGLFESPTEATTVVEELVAAGHPRDEISLVVHEHAATEHAGDETSGTVVATGVGAGAVLGGVGGLLVGLGALAIPGIGPVLAAGPLAAMLAGAGIGAAAGSVLGVLASFGIPDDDAAAYAEAVRRGGALVAVRTDDATADRAVGIIARHHPLDLEAHASRWRKAGWTGYDPEGRAYTTDDLRAEREQWRATSEVRRPGRVGEPVGASGVIGGIRDESGRSVRAYGYSPADDADFLRHPAEVFGTRGRSWDVMAPAYRFGRDLTRNRRYGEADWAAVEPEARLQWEGRGRRDWAEVRDAVRYGWEQGRSRRAA